MLLFLLVSVIVFLLKEFKRRLDIVNSRPFPEVDNSIATASDGTASSSVAWRVYLIPTPGATPDTAGVDTTSIVGKYKADIDVTWLDVIDQADLGDTSEITYLRGKTEKGACIEIINGTTYVNGILMVNKTYALPKDYVPVNTNIDIRKLDYSKTGICDYAWESWKEMEKDAKAEGLKLVMNSGYRSYKTQKEIHANYAYKDGHDEADTYSARAGHSEHQTGLCFDLNSINDSFTDTPEGKWVNDNCWKYGYCIRFPKGQTEYTGYKYESWHLRYVGVELAEKLYNNGDWISMEYFFGLTSSYNLENSKEK